jgi:hypothetical protein
MAKIQQDTWVLTLSAINNENALSPYFTLDQDKLDGLALLAPEGVV